MSRVSNDSAKAGPWSTAAATYRYNGEVSISRHNDDFLGGDLPRTKKGNKYLLTIVCNVSRWIHAVSLKNLKAETVADELIDFFSYAGFPQCIKADNFQTFKGELFSALHKKLGVEMLFSAPYHSQSHGSIERANKTLEEILRKFLADHTRDWDTLIPYLLLLCEKSQTKVQSTVQHSSFLADN